MDLSQLAERMERAEPIDRLAGPLQEAVNSVLPRGPVKDALHGVWLGHALHPLLTDLPIGFWTSAWILDMVGGRRSQKAADTLVGLGVVSALPTAASGLADWSELLEPDRRVGAVHAMANVAATSLYAWSFLARRRGRRAKGVALGMAGAAAATVGGFLGGHLSYRRAAGVNRQASDTGPADWAPLTFAGDAAGDGGDAALTVGEAAGTPIVVARTGGSTRALAEACSHLGGPLHEGALVDGCVRCPWHGSMFRLEDGSVVRGPATAPQPAFEVRTADGRAEARRRRSEARA